MCKQPPSSEISTLYTSLSLFCTLCFFLSDWYSLLELFLTWTFNRRFKFFSVSNFLAYAFDSKLYFPVQFSPTTHFQQPLSIIIPFEKNCRPLNSNKCCQMYVHDVANREFLCWVRIFPVCQFNAPFANFPILKCVVDSGIFTRTKILIIL